MAEDGKIKIDKFDGHDFGFWKMQIEDYLYQKKLHQPLMKERASIADHVNEFISILSRLMSVDINFNYEVKALLLLSLLPESWSDSITTVNGSTGSTKLNFDNIRDLILREDIHKKASGESKSKKKGQSKNKQDIMCWNCNHKGHFKNQCSKPVTSKDKKVNMVARDYDDALVCCVENMIDDRIIDSNALFHATNYKEELERFKLRSARGNTRGSPYMVEVPSDGINATIDGRGNAALWHQRLGDISEKGFQILEEERQGNEVSLAHLRVFGCDSYVKVKDVTRDNLDAKSVKCTFIGYSLDEIGYCFWDSKSHKVIQSKDITFNEDSLYGAKAATNSSNLTMPNQKDQVVLEDSLENLANKSIVTEHGLSLEIIQSLGGSSYTSEGSENNKSFEDSERSDKEDSIDRASFEDGGSTHSEALSSKEFVQWKKTINKEMVSLEKNQTWSLVRLLARKKALQSKWVFKVKEEKDSKKRYKTRLVVKGFQQKQGVDYNEIFSQVVKMTTIRGFSVSWERRKPRVVEEMCYGPLLLLEEREIHREGLKKFNMKDAKARCQPLGDHFKLGKKQAPKMEAFTKIIAKVPYASALGSMMYAMDGSIGKLSSGCYALERGWQKVGMVEELDIAQRKYSLFCDNQSAIRTLSLKKILRAKNPTDMFTKLAMTKKLKLCATSTALQDN
nr:retrovirus-related Pol polyprotein from transposon TNT 1-94 [Tanacetum cinerariifolium]